MKISVVTCTWNSAATLGDTIRSVQTQHHADVEQIFVDGGSTDGTLKMIEQGCPQARVLHGVRGGISRAMNEGARAATGEVIAHLHSDDYFSGPEVLETVARQFATNEKVQWLFGQIAILRANEVHQPPQQPRPYSRARYVRGAATVAHPAVFIRRQAFIEAGGFDESLKYAMDIDLWLRLGVLHDPVQLADVFTVFREHPGSLSSANALAARREELAVRLRRGHIDPINILIYLARYVLRFYRLKKSMAHGRSAL